MATKLSDLSIDDLRATLRATEDSAGPNSTSVRIIRRELDRKLEGIADHRSPAGPATEHAREAKGAAK
jgi:hypothetical protein